MKCFKKASSRRNKSALLIYLSLWRAFPFRLRVVRFRSWGSHVEADHCFHTSLTIYSSTILLFGTALLRCSRMCSGAYTIGAQHALGRLKHLAKVKQHSIHTQKVGSYAWKGWTSHSAEPARRCTRVLCLQINLPTEALGSRVFNMRRANCSR